MHRHFKHLGYIYHALCLALVFCTFRVTIIFSSRSIVLSKSFCVADNVLFIRLSDVCVYQLLTLILYMLLLPFCRAGSHPLDNHAHRLQLDRGRRKLHAVHWPPVLQNIHLGVDEDGGEAQRGAGARWCVCTMPHYNSSRKAEDTLVPLPHAREHCLRSTEGIASV